MRTNIILQGDALTKLKELPEKSVNMSITSPPYWALRDYSTSDVIWNGDENCEHEWIIGKSAGDIRFRPGHNSQVGNHIKKEIWERPSRKEFESCDVENVCPVCHNSFEGKPWQKFCSTKCLNTLSNEQRTNTPQVSNFCQKCGAWKGQLGLEPTYRGYISHLCDIFDEVKRVLRDDGTCWVNIGDSYGGEMGKKSGWTDAKLGYGKQEAIDKGVCLTKKTKIIHQISQKCLVGIPFRFALEMINRGWILRNTIIWHKPNCMPSSVKDRFTVDFEYIFFFSKNKKYYFETQYESYEAKMNRWGGEKLKASGISTWDKGTGQETYRDRNMRPNSKGRNKRTVWNIKDRTTPYSIIEPEFRKEIIDFRNLPEHSKIREYLSEWKNKKKVTIDEIETHFGNQAGHHWFEKDGSYPSKEDWLELKKLLGFDDTFDECMTIIFQKSGLKQNSEEGRIKRTVWRICPKPFKEAHFACVSEDTEILTENGWMRYNEIKEGDNVFSYNRFKRKVELDKIQEICKYDYDGELIKIGNRDLDMLLTPNHRVYCLEKNNLINVKRADNLSEKIKIPISAEFDEEDEPKKYSDDLIRLVGWIVTEGNIKSKYAGISIYQNEGKNSEEIEQLLTNLKIDYKKFKRRDNQIIFYIGKRKKNYRLLMRLSEKSIWRLRYLPKYQLKLLFDVLIKADGCKRKDDGRLQYIQKDKEHIDNFQYIALRLGYSCIVSKRKDKDIYQAYLTNRRFVGIRKTNGRGKSIKRIKYKGIVWCPRTKNKTWVARRNGRVFITGNTYPEELCETPIKAGCPEGGIVLDPFFGAGTTGLVALKQNKKFVGIELNSKYIEIATKRLKPLME